MPEKLEQKMCYVVLNVARYNISHEVTKWPKPSHAEKTGAKCATENECNKCSNI